MIGPMWVLMFRVIYNEYISLYLSVSYIIFISLTYLILCEVAVWRLILKSHLIWFDLNKSIDGSTEDRVVQYALVRNGGGDVAIQGDSRSFLSVADLVTYFRCSRGGLATRLRRPLSQAALSVHTAMTRFCEMSCEIDRSDVSVSGPPSQVAGPYRLYTGTYKCSVNVREPCARQE